MLQIEGATVVRGGAAILNEAWLEVLPGQRWAVLGPNGAGKSTLLSLASAMIHPTSGTVRIFGERLGAVDVFELRPRIGLASVALAEQWPGSEKAGDVVLGAAWGMLGRWREQYDDLDEERARGLMAGLGVAHLADRSYATLSEGERKRVQIARALMTDPELLLLDEPAAGLDMGAREEMVAWLSELADDEIAPAIVMVTHHVEEIPPGFTHAVLLSDARVVASGPTEEVITAENLSSTFGVPLGLERFRGRFWAFGGLNDVAQSQDYGRRARP